MNLNEIIEVQETTIERLLGPNIAFVKDLSPQAGPIWADPVQVRVPLVGWPKME